MWQKSLSVNDFSLPTILLDEENHVILEWNAAAARALGYAQKDRPLLSMIRPAQGNGMHTRSKGAGSLGVLPYVTKNGELLLFQVIRQRLLGKKDVYVDTLILSPEQSDSLKIGRYNDFESAITKSSIVSRADKRGVITYVNENFVAISGYAANELIGQTHRVINSGYHPKNFWVNMWKAISDGKIWRAEVKNEAKDGSYYWVDTFVMPCLDEQGQIREFLSIRNDITQSKLAELALEHLNSSLSETLVFGKMGSAELDMKTLKLCVSKELWRMLDVEVTEAQNISLNDFLQQFISPNYLTEVQQKIDEGMQALDSEKQIVQLEFEMVSAKGRKIWIEGKGIFKKDMALGILIDVTERKKSELHNFEQKELYKAILNSLPGVFYLFDEHGKFLRWNKNFEIVSGYNAEEISRMSPLDFFKDEEKPTIQEKIRLVFETGMQEVEANFLTKSGVTIPFYFNGLEMDFEGKRCVIGTGLDISVQKNTECLLRESEARLSNIYNQTPAMMYSIDRHGRLTRVSDFWLQKMEYTREEVLGKPSVDFLTKSSRKRALEEYLPAFFKEGVLSNVEYDFVTKSGQVLHTLLSATAEYSEKDTISKSLAVVTDITEKKELEIEVSKLAAIVQYTSNAVILTDVEGKITWANKGFERLTGYLLREVLDKKPGSFLQGPETDQATVLRMRKAIKNKVDFKEEILNYSKSGRPYWLDIEVMPIKDQAGVVTGFMAIETDITDLKTALEEMQRSEQALQTFMDYAPLNAFIKDTHGRYTFFNKAYQEFLNKKILKAGVTDFQLLKEPLAKVNAVHDSNVIETGNVIKLERVINKKTFLEYRFPLYDAYHKIFAVGGISIDITEKLKAQRLIAENEQRLRSIADHLTDGVIYQYVVDAAGAIESFPYISNGAIDLFEVAAEEIMNNPMLVFNMVHAEDIHQMIRLSEASRVGLVPFDFEYRIVAPSAKVKWVHTRSTPRRLADGRTIWDGLTVNTTTRKKLELALQSNEAKLQSIFQRMISGVLVVDVNGEITYANPSAANILALEHNESEHRFYPSVPWKQINENGELYLPEQLPLTIALQQRQSVSDIEHGIVVNQTTKWLSVSAAPLFDNQQNLIGAVASFLDITEQKEAQRELKRVHDELTAILNASTEATFFMDADYRILVFNKSGEKGIQKIFNKRVKRGDSMLDYVVPGVVNDFKRNFKRALQGEPVMMEREIQYTHTIRVWNHIRYLPVFRNDKIIGVSFSAMDITSRKKAEQALFQKNRQVQLAVVLANMGEWELDVISLVPYWSDEVCRIHEVPEGYLPDLEGAFNFYTPECQPIIKKAVKNCIEEGKSYDLELELITAKGNKRTVRTIGLSERIGGKTVKLFGLFQDVTIQKLAQTELIKANRLYAVTSEINQMIVHAKTQEEVFLQACRIAIDHGKFRMAWVGMVNKVTSIIEPVAMHGFINDYFSEIDPISTLNIAAGKGPTGTAVREKRTVFNNNISTPNPDYSLWRNEALKRNFQSSIALPILKYGEVLAVFTLYKSEPDFFTEREVRLLEEVTANIAFAVNAIETKNDRAEKEKALIESEERFRMMADTAPVFIWLTNTDKLHTYFNKVYLNFTCRSLEQETGTGWVQTIHAEDFQKSYEIFETAFNNKQPYQMEYRLRHYSGAYRWILSTGMPRYLHDGTFVGYIGTGIDITDRKHAEEELLKSKEEYQRLVQMIPVGVYKNKKMPEGREKFFYVSSRWCELHGVTMEQALADPEVGIRNIHPEDLPSFIEQSTGAQKHETNFIWEGRRILNNEVRYIHIESSPERLKNGEVLWNGIEYDITERKQSEAQLIESNNRLREFSLKLAESEERYRNLFEANPVPTWIFDATSLFFLDVNKAAVQHYGYTKEEFLSKTILDIRPQSDQLRLLNSLVMPNTPTPHNPWKHVRKDGTLIDVEVNGLPFTYDNHKAVLITVNDITENLRYQNNLLNSIKEKELLIKEIHHRVKNNLQLISSILYLKLITFQNTEVRDFLSGMREKIKSISLIHERLLQSGMVDSVNASDYLIRLIKDIQVGFYRKDLDLEIETQCDSFLIQSDTAMYCGLIVNELVTNAIKYAFPNRDKGWVVVSFKQTDPNVFQLVVGDNGIGLAEEIKPQESTSFGMQLLSVFVQQLNGTLVIARNNGTTFCITFKKIDTQQYG
jgi:PAS domain S-box-containing protein